MEVRRALEGRQQLRWSWVARRRDLEVAAQDLDHRGGGAVRLCQEGAPSEQRAVSFLYDWGMRQCLPVVLASEWRAEGGSDL